MLLFWLKGEGILVLMLIYGLVIDVISVCVLVYL